MNEFIESSTMMEHSEYESRQTENGATVKFGEDDPNDPQTDSVEHDTNDNEHVVCYPDVANYLNSDFKSDIKPYVCSLCAQCFSEEADLKEHFLNTHKPGKGYKAVKPIMKPKDDFVCDICHANFQLKRDYKQHMYTHTQKELHQCKICGKILKTKQVLSRHILIHGKDTIEEHPCAKCDRVFKMKCHLSQHMTNAHSDKRDAAVAGSINTQFCDICKKTLSKKTSMYLHMQTHSEERAFHCVLCDQTFRTRHTLRQHLTKHSDHKPFPCPHCDLAFRRKLELNNHVRVHNGERPFACSQPGCARAFRKQSDLGRHVLIHTGDKPHTCYVCQKAFRQKGSLRTHLRVHNGDKPHLCPECPKRFRTRGNLFSHIRYNHDNHEEIMARIQNRRIYTDREPVLDDDVKEEVAGSNSESEGIAVEIEHINVKVEPNDVDHVVDENEVVGSNFESDEDRSGGIDQSKVKLEPNGVDQVVVKVEVPASVVQW